MWDICCTCRRPPFPSPRPPGQRQRSFSLSDLLVSSEVALHLCLVLYGCYPGLLVLELRLQLAFIPGISGNSPDLLHGLCLSQSKLTHAFLCSSTNLRAHTVWRALACRGLGGGMELFGACTCLDRACQWGRWCLRAQDRILMKMSFRGSTASPYLPVSSGNSAPQSAGRLTGFRALSARAFRATVLEGIPLAHCRGLLV